MFSSYISAVEKDLLLRSEGFKKEVRGFRITHKKLPDEKAKECLKSLKNICGIQPNKTYTEYKNFLRNSEDNLKTIEERIVWMIKEGGYAKVEDFH